MEKQTKSLRSTSWWFNLFFRIEGEQSSRFLELSELLALTSVSEGGVGLVAGYGGPGSSNKGLIPCPFFPTIVLFENRIRFPGSPQV